MAASPDRTDSIFADAVLLGSVEEREAFLDRVCAGDAALRLRLDGLLHAHDLAGNRRESPALLPDSLAQTIGDSKSNDEVGTWVAGRFKLLEQIGEGGMGTVWVAEQTQPVRRKVALKLIKAGMDSKAVLARFEAERQALALMDHPNIAKVLDGGSTESGRPFFVMEYVKGVPLTEYCDSTRLSIAQRLELFVAVCQAVQHAHQKGIIHRDLKPSNILICLYDGKPVPKVIDFGLAKAMYQPLTEQTVHTAHGLVIGTPLYMSPEQAELSNLDVDTRTDIYALGVILYELLTGTTPLEKQRFKAAAWQEMLRLIKDEEPPRPSARLSGSASLPSVAAQRGVEPVRLARLLRGELDWVVMRCLEKQRDRRYETANALARDIQRYLADEPVEARPPTWRYQARKFLRRNATAVLAAFVVFLALLGGIVGVSLGLRHAIVARRETESALAETELARKEAIRHSEEARRQSEIAATNERQAQRQNQLAESRRREAEEQAAIARAVNEFLQQDLLRQADSTEQASQGHPPEPNLTVREALNRAQQRVGERFAKQPLVEAAVRKAIGDSYCGLGFWADAIPHYERAHRLFVSERGDDDPEALTAADALAGALSDSGHPDRAVPILIDVYARQKNVRGLDDTETWRSLANLGYAHLVAGKYDLAIPCLQEALDQRIRLLGIEHRHSLGTLDNLAGCYAAKKQYDQAIPLFEQEVQTRRKLQGEEHPENLRAMNNLAHAYEGNGQLDEATSLFQRSYDGNFRSLGEEHPETLTSLNNLAYAHYRAKNHNQALTLFESVIEKSRRVLPAGNRPLSMALFNSGAVLHETGEQDRALQRTGEAIDVARQSFGPTHPITLDMIDSAIVLYLRANRAEQSLPWFRERVAGSDNQTNEDLDRHDFALFNAGARLYNAGDHRAAAEIFRACVEYRQRAHPEAWGTHFSEFMLGVCLLFERNFDEARPRLQDSLAMLKTQFAAQPQNKRDELLNLLEPIAKFYEQAGHVDDATFFRRARESLTTEAGARQPSSSPSPK